MKRTIRQTTLLLLLVMTVSLLVSAQNVNQVRATKFTDLLSGGVALILSGGTSTAPAGMSDGDGSQPNTVFGKDVRLSTDPPALIVVNQNEPTITVSPVDRDNLVAGFHDPLTHPERGEVLSCAFTTSFDGGKTWTKFGAVQHPVPTDQCSDPALDADFRGDFYYAYLSVRLGCQTGLAACTIDITVSRSVDHGRTFGPPTIAFSGTLDVNLPDKEYIAADSSSTSPYRGNVYVSFTLFDITPGATDTTGCRIMFVRSTNGGQTFEPAVQISPHFNCRVEGGPFGNVVQGSMPAVGPDGTVYVAYYDSTEDGWGPGLGGVGFYTPMIAKSVDGGRTFSKPVVMATLNELPFALPPTSFRSWSSMFPITRVAYDHLVYSVMTTNPTGPDDGDIVLLKSGNRGKTWDSPARVNDDSTTSDQFFPWLAVQPDGTVHVIFGDRRDDKTDRLYHVYYTELSKGSGRFRNNLRVTDAVSDPAARNLTFIGDYFNIAASDTAVHPIWTDNRATPSSRFPDILVDKGITPVHGG